MFIASFSHAFNLLAKFSTALLLIDPCGKCGCRNRFRRRWRRRYWRLTGLIHVFAAVKSGQAGLDSFVIKRFKLYSTYVVWVQPVAKNLEFSNSCNLAHQILSLRLYSSTLLKHIRLIWYRVFVFRDVRSLHFSTPFAPLKLRASV